MEIETPNSRRRAVRQYLRPEKPTHERAMILMLRGWLEYAEAQKSAFDSNIGDDYVLGDEWFKIGEALRGLLNGDLGRLDGGTLDTIIADNLNEQGFDPDLGERKQHGKA